VSRVRAGGVRGAVDGDVRGSVARGDGLLVRRRGAGEDDAVVQAERAATACQEVHLGVDLHGLPGGLQRALQVGRHAHAGRGLQHVRGRDLQHVGELRRAARARHVHVPRGAGPAGGEPRAPQRRQRGPRALPHDGCGGGGGEPVRGPAARARDAGLPDEGAGPLAHPRLHLAPGGPHARRAGAGDAAGGLAGAGQRHGRDEALHERRRARVHAAGVGHLRHVGLERGRDAADRARLPGPPARDGRLPVPGSP
jgi:hypothetical protein